MTPPPAKKKKKKAAAKVATSSKKSTPGPRATATPAKKDTSRPAANPPKVNQKIVSVFRATSGDGTHNTEGLSAGVADAVPVGIKLPSFCWEAFLGTTVFPLETILFLAGRTESCKTGLIAEITRWAFETANGVGRVAENENKWSDTWFPSIIGWDRDCFSVAECTSFDESQSALLSPMKELGKYMRKDLNKVHEPIVFGLDSVTGNTTDSEQQKIQKENKATRGFAETALAASKLLPGLSPYLKNLPFLLIAIAHISLKKDHLQRDVEHRKGGQTWDFFASYIFHMRAIGPIKSTQHYMMKPVRISAYKRPGTGAGCIECPIKWGFEEWVNDENPDEVIRRQVTKFDWDEASLTMLSAPGKCKIPTLLAQNLTDILPVTYGTDGISCKYFGIKKADRVSPREFMQRVYEDEKLLRELRQALCIKPAVALDGEISYGEAKKQAKELALKRRNMTTLKKTVLFD